MDDLVAALHLLAQKLRVDVGELSDRYVLYTQISAIALFVVNLICAYATYRIINYICRQYKEADPVKIMETRTKKIKDDLGREIAVETAKIARSSALAGVNAARITLMAIIMGVFLISAASQIPAIIVPQGAALDKVFETMKDATKVEIVQNKECETSERPKKVDEAAESEGADDGRLP